MRLALISGNHQRQLYRDDNYDNHGRGLTLGVNFLECRRLPRQRDIDAFEMSFRQLFDHDFFCRKSIVLPADRPARQRLRLPTRSALDPGGEFGTTAPVTRQ